MRAIILGSAAGGGVPQWNCGCRVCRLARLDDGRVAPRTQSSLAVTADGVRWLLVNASPDLRQQLADTPALHPTGPRTSPLAAVLLTNGDVDHVAGLLTLREGQPFTLHATAETLDALAGNPIFAVLDGTVVPRRPVRLDETFTPVPGLAVTLFAVPGKVPLWLEEGEVTVGAAGEATVGLDIAAGGRRLVYVPGCAAVTAAVRRRVAGADALLFDGTLWTDDEMIDAGLGRKSARRMGHVPLTGPDGSLQRLAGIDAERRILVHINNTNPVLVAGSAERAAAAAAGWEVGCDGMEIAL